MVRRDMEYGFVLFMRLSAGHSLTTSSRSAPVQRFPWSHTRPPPPISIAMSSRAPTRAAFERLIIVKYGPGHFHAAVPAGLENALSVSLIFDNREFSVALQTPLAGGSQLYTFGCHGAARRLHGPEIPDMPCGSIVYLVLDNEMLQYMIRGKPGPRARARARALKAAIAPAPILVPVGFGDDDPSQLQVVPAASRAPPVPSASVPVALVPDNEHDFFAEAHASGKRSREEIEDPNPSAKRQRALNGDFAPAPIPMPIHVIAPAPILVPVGFGDDEPGEPQVVPLGSIAPAVPSAFVPVADEPDNERDLLEELLVAGEHQVPDDVREWRSALIRSSELTDTGACRTASLPRVLR